MEPAKAYIPELGRQSLAVDFIDNRLGKYHPGFATPPARYDPALDSFIISSPPADAMQSQQTFATPQQGNVHIGPRPVPKPVAALQFWNFLFDRAMGEFKLASEEPKGREKAGFSIRDKTNWAAVFDQLEKARDFYSGKKRPSYRKLADHAAPVALDVIKLVPDMNSVFVTPVVASVRIILEAVKKAAEVRKEMECAFDDIDMMFSEIELFLQAFPDDEHIVQASVELITATFSAIEAVIGFFTKSALKRSGRAILSRETYEQQMLDTLKKVESSSQRLLRQAKDSGLLLMSEGLRRILARQEKLHHEGKDFFKSVVDSAVDTLLKQLAANLANKKDLDLLYVAIQANSRPASPIPPPYESVAESHIDPQDLLDWIEIPNVVEYDLKIINEKRQTRVPMNEQARAEQLIQARQLKEWVVSPESTQLLVHGEYEGKQDISGLSLLCSYLAQSLVARAPLYIPLLFFCGLHTDRNVDDYTGGLAMVQSFICQLLCQFDFDKKLLVVDVDEDRIRDADIGQLCDLFELLVKQLPSTVVLFCIIDGIVYYERNEFVDDMGLVLVTLLKISEQKGQATVKVLVTSPTVTRLVRKPFPDELILSMATTAHSDEVASKARLERQLAESLEEQIDAEVG
ncbi:hypothetical protein CLAIMM_12882 [Cladophialophora immunda]|nr:hypothetical protein CLAIMM_12882 [Cladophialophora immunda]